MRAKRTKLLDICSCRLRDVYACEAERVEACGVCGISNTRGIDSLNSSEGLDVRSKGSKSTKGVVRTCSGAVRGAGTRAESAKYRKRRNNECGVKLYG